ncbi:type VI secretion system tube protein Hcp [Ideonella sp. DXS22W]|uniref:Type VI secretion system tube protein Hcp n=1 Tax=Pseudaquabacterium inlustre TaxID=2984192 RepID=A0ABU9CN37_9BURK
MHPIPWRRGALALACLLLSSASQAAGERIQLGFKNLEVLGSSTLRGYERTIDVDSFQWGVSVGVGQFAGVGERTVSPPSISDIVWTQGLDRSYAGLGNAISKPGVATSTFSFLTSNGTGYDPYLTIEAQRASITGLSFSAGGGQPSVSASETFDLLKLSFRTELLAGQRPTSTPVVVSYDASNNSVSGSMGRSTSIRGRNSTSGLYLKLGSASSDSWIKGDSTLQGYQSWIALDSAQMGVGVAISHAGGRVTAVPSFSELTVTQQLDGAVPAVLANLLAGRTIGEATLVYLETVQNVTRVVTELRMANVVMSGMSFSSGGDVPSVAESLNFTGYQQTVWEYSGTSAKSSIVTMGWMGTAGLDSAEAAGSSPPGPAPLPVPEPGTWALMLGGAALLLARRRGLSPCRPVAPR